MGIREWDRKIKNLANEISTLCDRYGRYSGQDETRIQGLQKRLGLLQKELETKLSWVHTLSRDRSFLSETEKTLMHWARSWSETARSLYKQHGEAWQELFWARLARMRTTHLSEGGSGTGGLEYQRFCREEMERLRQVRTELTKRRARLDERYHYLAVGKMNRQSSHPELPPGLDRHSVLPRKPVIHSAPDSSEFPQIAETSPEGADQMQGRNQDSRALAQDASGKAPGGSSEFLKQFDYLGLDDHPDPSFFLKD